MISGGGTGAYVTFELGVACATVPAGATPAGAAVTSTVIFFVSGTDPDSGITPEVGLVAFWIGEFLNSFK